MSRDEKPETTTTPGAVPAREPAARFVSVSGQPQIYAALNACMREVGHIGKDRKPKDGVQFKFRGVDDVYLALQPLFGRHGVIAMPRVLDSQYSEVQTKRGGMQTYCRMKVEYTFYALDGSSVVAVTAGEAQDTSDKSTPKAMSIAYKYAMFQVLAIPCEEVHNDWDPDFEKDDRTVPGPDAKGQPAEPLATREQIAELDKLGLAYSDRNPDKWRDLERQLVLWVSDDVADRAEAMTVAECDKLLTELRSRLETKQAAAKGTADTRNQQQPAGAGRRN